MSKLKKIILVLLSPLLLFLVYAIACIGFAKFTYFNPKEKIILSENIAAPKLEKDSFSALIWNIGYAGLGAETDFFYDGGKMMCPPKSLSDTYLAGIQNTLEQNPSDFTMLQEVDIDSRRSYNIDQVSYLGPKKTISKNFALNYKVHYIPLPWTNPMGKVAAGLLTYSNHQSSEVMRYQLPGTFGFPKQLFFLRRCLLVTSYPLINGKKP